MEARAQHLLANEHFFVDGTLIEGCVSLKSFQHKDGAGGLAPVNPDNLTVAFRGEARSSATHASATDSDARLYQRRLITRATS